MYEPYPYKIGKLRIFFYAFLILLFTGGFFGFQLRPEVYQLKVEQFAILNAIVIFILFLSAIFSFKSYSSHYSGALYIIGLGAISFLFFKIIRYFLLPIVEISESAGFRLLLFELIGIIPFSFCLLFSAFNSEKIVTTGKRRAFAVWGVIAILTVSSLLYLLLKRVLPFHPQLKKFGVTIPDLLAMFNLAILLFAFIKYNFLYFKSRHNIYFWYIITLLSYVFSLIYLFISQQQASLNIAYFIAQLGGVTGILLVHFVENTRLMESELELRRDLEKSLFRSKESLKEMQLLVDGVNVGICVFNEKGTLSFFNKKFLKLTGLTENQLKLKSERKFFDAENFEKYQIEKEKLKSGNSTRFEVEIQVKDRQNLPVMIAASPIMNSFRRLRGVRWVVFEIAEKKAAEQRLKDYSANLEQKIKEKTADLEEKTSELNRAKKYYETLISGMLDILLVVDRKGDCTFINPYGKKLLGYEAKQLTSKRLPDFFSDMNRIKKNYGDAMKVELRDYEAPVKTRDGRVILCNWNVRYLFDADGRNIGAMCVGRDVSEYKAMQKKLEAHSRNLKQLVAQRTRELNDQLNKLSKVIKIGEIALDTDPEKIPSHVCTAMKSFGWKYVVFSLKDNATGEFRIAAYAGITQRQIRKFVKDRDFLYKDVFQFIRDDFKISHSYLVKNKGKAAARKNFRVNKQKSGDIWQADDVLIIPVKFKTKILGFINLFHPRGGKYPDEHHVKILEAFARKAAVALENRRLFDQIKERMDELARVSKIKADFFTMMSHELRTPLNSIISLADVLGKQMTGELNAEQLQQIQIIRQNGRELLKLINNILDLSKIEAGKMDVSFNYFSVVELIQDNVMRIQPLCERKNLKLEVDVDKKMPKFIFSDQEKINRVLTNMMGNAVKFTQKGKIKLTVKFDKKRSEIQFTVTDTGVGMTEKEIARIFQRFSQTDQISRKKFEGSGLGLSISQKLVELLHGSITVESKKGKGSAFRILIPVKGFSDEWESFSLSSKKEKARKTSGKKKSHKIKAGKQKIILLVDDNPDNHYAVNFILEEQGHKVLYAADGAKGIKIARKKKPDLILMDMMMPGIDGYQATQKIRQINGMKDVPIIAMTAKTVQEDKKRAIKAGCNDYLTKPFTLEDILAKVQKWLGGTNG